MRAYLVAMSVVKKVVAVVAEENKAVLLKEKRKPERKRALPKLLVVHDPLQQKGWWRMGRKNQQGWRGGCGPPDSLRMAV